MKYAVTLRAIVEAPSDAAAAQMIVKMTPLLKGPIVKFALKSEGVDLKDVEIDPVPVRRP